MWTKFCKSLYKVFVDLLLNESKFVTLKNPQVKYSCFHWSRWCIQIMLHNMIIWFYIHLWSFLKAKGAGDSHRWGCRPYCCVGLWCHPDWAAAAVWSFLRQETGRGYSASWTAGEAAPVTLAETHRLGVFSSFQWQTNVHNRINTCPIRDY